MLHGEELIRQGRDAAPTQRATTAYLRKHNANSEAEYKLRCRDERRTTFHMHVGLSTWEQTEAALIEVSEGLAAEGHSIDRYGLAMDRAMGIPEAERDRVAKETGPPIFRHAGTYCDSA